jgi:hypothetical protein
MRYGWPTSAALLLITVFLAGSTLAASRDASRFYGAQLLQDGNTVLFSYTRAEYVVKSSGLVNFGGGRAHYLRDRKYIGLYHMDSDTTEVLKTFPMERDSNGRGNIFIRATRGRKAMVYREPRGTGQAELPGERYIFDIDENTLNRVGITAEMAELGMEEHRTVWLSHGDGSLAVLAYAAGQKEGQKNSVPLGHIWLRRETGRYHLLTTLGSYTGTVQDEVLYYDHGSRKSMAYNVTSRANRVVSNRELADLKLYDTRYGKPIQDTHVSLDKGGKGLRIGRKTDGKWQYEPFQINMAPLR